MSYVILSPNLSSVWFFLGITIQGKRLYVALVLYDAEKMRSCPLNYPTQSFYTKNLDVITSEFQPLHYDFPHYSPWDHTAYQIVPIPQLNSWDPNLGDTSFTACPNSGYLSLILRSSESPRNHFHTCKNILLACNTML